MCFEAILSLSVFALHDRYVDSLLVVSHSSTIRKLGGGGGGVNMQGNVV